MALLLLGFLASLGFAAASSPLAGLPSVRACGLSETEEVLARKLLDRLPSGSSPRAYPEWFAPRASFFGLTPRGCLALLERTPPHRPATRPGGADAERRERFLERLSAVVAREGGKLFDGSRALGSEPPLVGAPSEKGRSGGALGAARARKTGAPPPARPALPEPQESCLLGVFCSAPARPVAYARLPGRLFVRGQRPRAADPGDVKQGGLGDCYLMAALGAIAKADPGRIRRMIRRDEHGVYGVTFFTRRRSWEFWRPEHVEARVRVDAAVPLKDGKAAFAKPGGAAAGRRELWPMLVEKAYAKLKGSYGMIDGGLPEKALEELTGRTPRVHDAAGVSIRELAAWSARGDAVVVDTPFSLLELWWPSASVWRTPKYRSQNFVSNHCYWVHRVDVERGLVVLANPWGRRYKLVVLTEEEFRLRAGRVSVVSLG